MPKFILLVILFISGCSSQKNKIRLTSYQSKVQNYGCQKTEAESEYIERHLKALNSQNNGSIFEAFMEFIASLGTSAFTGKRSLNKEIELFESKKTIINNHKLKVCHEKK